MYLLWNCVKPFTPPLVWPTEVLPKTRSAQTKESEINQRWICMHDEVGMYQVESVKFRVGQIHGGGWIVTASSVVVMRIARDIKWKFCELYDISLLYLYLYTITVDEICDEERQRLCRGMKCLPGMDKRERERSRANVIRRDVMWKSSAEMTYCVSNCDRFENDIWCIYLFL